jgi:hypothetical protein
MKYLKILFLLTAPLFLRAQQEQKVDVGIFGGFANYQGDLVEDPIVLSETRLSYGAFVRYHLSNNIKVRGNIFFGFISGDDQNASEGFKSRGWSFESNLLELSLMGEYHPIGRSRQSETGLFRNHISPYVALGAGLAFFDPKVTVTKTEHDGFFPESGASTNSITFPFALGVRADVHEHLSLGFEWGWRFTFNDYLDGVSVNGNPDRNDLYIFMGLNASYFFGDLQGFSFEKQ